MDVKPRRALIVLSICFFVFLISAGWFYRRHLYLCTIDHPGSLPAVFASLFALLVPTIFAQVIELHHHRNRWRDRTASLAGLPGIKPVALQEKITKKADHLIARITSPVLRSRNGKTLQTEWIDSGFPGEPGLYLVFLMTSALFGGAFGGYVASAFLGIVLAIVFPLLFRMYIVRRGEANRRRFGEQLPFALEVLATGLSAGLSFQQSLDFSKEEIGVPVGTLFARLSRRLSLGFSLEKAAKLTKDDYPDEGMMLILDGVVLQNQYGGDLVQMMTVLGKVLRERVELQKEVQAITAQGRLSGMVVAGLVPISAFFLFSFNPAYMEVMFESLIGQLLIVLTLAMLLLGWSLISRLVRIKY